MFKISHCVGEGGRGTQTLSFSRAREAHFLNLIVAAAFTAIQRTVARPLEQHFLDTTVSEWCHPFRGPREKTMSCKKCPIAFYVNKLIRQQHHEHWTRNSTCPSVTVSVRWEIACKGNSLVQGQVTVQVEHYVTVVVRHFSRWSTTRIRLPTHQKTK